MDNIESLDLYNLVDNQKSLTVLVREERVLLGW